MGLTKESLRDLGFKPEQRKSVFQVRYKALVYRLSETDYLYIPKNSQTVFKSFIEPTDNKRYATPVIKLNETGLIRMKEYLDRITLYYGQYNKTGSGRS
jgi:hypothetical protein